MSTECNTSGEVVLGRAILQRWNEIPVIVDSENLSLNLSTLFLFV